MRFGFLRVFLLSFHSPRQPPLTWWRLASFASVSPRTTVTRLMEAVDALTAGFTFDLLALALALAAPGLVAGTAFLSALPFFLVSPARRLHVGHAPGPCPASTRRAMAICSAFVALCAWLAYLRPPKAFQV